MYSLDDEDFYITLTHPWLANAGPLGTELSQVAC